MQSNLREINIQSFLIFLLKEQKQGTLSVKIPIKEIPEGKLSQVNFKQSETFTPILDDRNNFLIKNIFLFGGEITYAFNSNESWTSRIKDYLTYYQLALKLDEYIGYSQASNFTQIEEYNFLIWLLQKKYLNPSQFKAIITQLIEETLFEIFICQQGEISFEANYHSYSGYYGRSTINTICKLHRNLRQWKQLKSHIRSPYQCLHLEDRTYLKNTLSAKTYESLISWAEDRKSLIQLSRQLNCSLIYIGKALYPYLQQGLLTLKTHRELSKPEDSIL